MKMTAVSPRASIAKKMETLVVVAFGFAGWALCAATMGIGMKLTTLQTALIVHAVAAPCIFAAVSFFYFRRQCAWRPLRAAAAFLAVVAALDFFVVALGIQHSFVMFESIFGLWLPFLLIFLTSWLTGVALWGTRFQCRRL